MSQQRRRALLIEDDSAIASLMVELLQGLGFATDHILGREHAAGVAGRARPDLIVTDLLSAGGPGASWDDVEALRRAIPGVPLLVVTGHEAALAEGAARGIAVLAKPFDLEEFEQAVVDLLGR